MTSRISSASVMGSAERAAGSGVGVYAMHKLVGSDLGRIQAPVFGSMDGAVFMALLSAAATMVEEPVKGYLPRSPIGGTFVTVGDVAARGVVPAVAYKYTADQSMGMKGVLKTSALNYVGSSAGIYAVNQFMRK